MVMHSFAGTILCISHNHQVSEGIIKSNSKISGHFSIVMIIYLRKLLLYLITGATRRLVGTSSRIDGEGVVNNRNCQLIPDNGN